MYHTRYYSSKKVTQPTVYFLDVIKVTQTPDCFSGCTNVQTYTIKVLIEGIVRFDLLLTKIPSRCCEENFRRRKLQKFTTTYLKKNQVFILNKKNKGSGVYDLTKLINFKTVLGA